MNNSNGNDGDGSSVKLPSKGQLPLKGKLPAGISGTFVVGDSFNNVARMKAAAADTTAAPPVKQAAPPTQKLSSGTPKKS